MSFEKFKNLTDNLEISKNDINCVVDAIKNEDISWPNGYTKKLENAVANFLDCKYVLAHCNGTSALYSAISSLPLDKNDEIICPSYTWWSSAAPVVNLGFKLIFCEVNKDLTIDFLDIEKKISKKTRAIIVPHLWGNMCNVLELKKILKKCSSEKFFIIEDASHVFGGKYKNKFLGTFGDVGVFSMQKNKFLTAGEGGLLVTNNKKLFLRSLFLGHYERIRKCVPIGNDIRKFINTGGGYKFRIHPLASAFAFSQLQRIRQKQLSQNKLMGYIKQKLANFPHLRVCGNNPIEYITGGIYSLRISLDCTFTKRQLKYLSKNFNISKEYLSLLHLEPFFSKARFTGKGALPNTEKFYSNLYSFPVFYRGDMKLIDEYLSELKLFLSK